MNSITIVNGLLLLILLAALRKLIWCLRWLWCYYRGKEVPEPISFLPHRSGDSFDRRVEQVMEEKEN